MRVIINGAEQDVEDGLSLSELLKKLELSSARIAVELNLEVVRKTEWSNIMLMENDKLEIIHFVGGG
jgi:sulfur carrier protein